MAETFVVDFAVIGLRVQSGVIATSREKGGVIIVGRDTEPLWTGPMTTGKLQQTEYQALHAQLTDAVQRNLRFDFVHPRFRLPRGYTDASWPLMSDPVLVEIVDLYTITVSGLEVGMTLPRGTRFTLMQDDPEVRCYRELSSAVTVSSTIEQSLAFTPRLPLGVFAPEALVRFKDPMVRLAIVPDSDNLAEEYQATPVTFQAEEAGA